WPNPAAPLHSRTMTGSPVCATPSTHRGRSCSPRTMRLFAPAAGTAARALPWLLRSAGVLDVRAKVHAKLVDMDNSRRTHHLGLLEVMHEKIVSLGKLKESELAEHKKALRQHLADPDTVVIDHLLVQAWGRKPC